MLPINTLSERVIGCAIEVHRHIGPGLLESAYQRCLAREFEEQGIPFRAQLELPVLYKGAPIDCAYRLDFLIDGRLVLEIKSVAKVEPIHEAQLLTYLRLGGWELGLLLNFNVARLVDGVRRKVLGLRD
ncbi:MAG: GxxExxY protein [Tepidisphaeraceae bacterium]